MKINVQLRSYGWDEPVTVTKKENDEVIFCNHADNYVEDVENSYEDDSWTDRVLICRKCGSIKLMNVNGARWEHAPEMGIV